MHLLNRWSCTCIQWFLMLFIYARKAMEVGWFEGKVVCGFELSNVQVNLHGQRFFHVLLISDEDKKHVWSIGSILLKLSILQLHEWSPDFKLETQKFTNSQVWVLFFHNWVYWHPNILFDLAILMGVPLRFDQNTMNSDFCHYACILLEVDLSKKLPKYVLLNKQEEGGNYCLFGIW